MIAIGLILVAAGWFIVNAFGSPYPTCQNNGDFIGATSGLIGAILVIAGLATWLWRVMP